MLTLIYLGFSDQLAGMASERGIVLMSAVPAASYPDIMVEDEPVQLLDEMIAEVAEKYKIPENRVITGGFQPRAH